MKRNIKGKILALLLLGGVVALIVLWLVQQKAAREDDQLPAPASGSAVAPR